MHVAVQTLTMFEHVLHITYLNFEVRFKGLLSPFCNHISTVQTKTFFKKILMKDPL